MRGLYANFIWGYCVGYPGFEIEDFAGLGDETSRASGPILFSNLRKFPLISSIMSPQQDRGPKIKRRLTIGQSDCEDGKSGRYLRRNIDKDMGKRLAMGRTN